MSVLTHEDWRVLEECSEHLARVACCSRLLLEYHLSDLRAIEPDVPARDRSGWPVVQLRP